MLPAKYIPTPYKMGPGRSLTDYELELLKLAMYYAHLKHKKATPEQLCAYLQDMLSFRIDKQDFEEAAKDLRPGGLK